MAHCTVCGRPISEYAMYCWQHKKYWRDEDRIGV